MRHFDDIPISQIQKMPGYQTGDAIPGAPVQMMDEYPPGQNPVGTGPDQAGLEEEDAQSKSLYERA